MGEEKGSGRVGGSSLQCSGLFWATLSHPPHPKPSPPPPTPTPVLSTQCPLPAPAQDPLEHRSLKMCPSLLLQAQASPHSALITPSPPQASGTLLLSLLPNAPTRLLPPRWRLSPLTSREHMLGLVGGKECHIQDENPEGHSSHELTPLCPGSSDNSPLQLQAPGRPDRRVCICSLLKTLTCCWRVGSRRAGFQAESKRYEA